MVKSVIFRALEEKKIHQSNYVLHILHCVRVLMNNVQIYICMRERFRSTFHFACLLLTTLTTGILSNESGQTAAPQLPIPNITSLSKGKCQHWSQTRREGCSSVQAGQTFHLPGLVLEALTRWRLDTLLTSAIILIYLYRKEYLCCQLRDSPLDWPKHYAAN